jgi:NADH-quinone oxidoreductase subunit C
MPLLNTIATPYAEALLQVAESRKETDTVAEQAKDLLAVLRSSPELQAALASPVLEPDAKKAAKVSWQPHIEMVYHLWSTPARATLVLKTKLPRWSGDVAGQLPELPSVTSVWRTADWHEREVYDLSGVNFTGHPDLRRILCPEDWVGHPLRKDYEMPLDYHGIRGK